MYDVMLIFGITIARFLSMFDKKINLFFKLRKYELNRIANYFKGIPQKKTIWFHAASAGEFEQAKPLIEYLRSNISGIRIVASFFSPSGYKAGQKYEYIEFCFNLPVDLKTNIKQILDYIDPYMIIYAKYDIWRNLTIQAKSRGIKLLLISGTLPENSYRHRFPFRLFFAKPYTMLDTIYAISVKDEKRFQKITSSNNVLIAGDTRFERIRDVLKDKNDRNSGKKFIKKNADSIYFIAGSTYKKSEKYLLAAYRKLKINNSAGRLKFVIVPHEVNEPNIDRLGKLIESYNYKCIRLSKSRTPIDIPDDSIIIVDMIGILALLYKEADIVFIGGSFKGKVHSVLEPAVFGRPIMTGPFIKNSVEALEMAKSGSLIACKNSSELYYNLLKVNNDPELRKRLSKKSKAYFQDNIRALEFIKNDIFNFF